MGLLQPDSGLLFWMCVAFGVVLFLLCKFGFPIIMGSIEQRREYIDSSLEEAQAARSESAQLKKESKHIIEDAQNRRWEILEKAKEEQEQLAAQIKAKAEQEAVSIIENARIEAQAQKEAIIRDAHAQVVTLSIAVAEKILRQKLQGEKEQAELAARMIEEMKDM